jgi:predicted nucleotidyltransferase
MTKKSIDSTSLAEALFTSQARLAVLKLLLLNPDRRFYLREIAAKADLPVRAVQVEVARLEASGLLQSSVEGNRKYHQANRRAPIFPELRSLLLKTVGLGDALKESLRRASGEIEVACVFGSIAAGTDTASSDIDLLVVGAMTGRALAGLLAPLRESLGREINPVLMTKAEFRRKVRDGNHFLRATLEGPRIHLIGGDDELSELAGRGATQATHIKPQGNRRLTRRGQAARATHPAEDRENGTGRQPAGPAPSSPDTTLRWSPFPAGSRNRP